MVATNRKLQCPNKPVQRFPVVPSDIIVHENWDPSQVVNGANDITLVRLSKVAYTVNEIASGVSVVPICLPWGPLPNGNVAKYPSGMLHMFMPGVTLKCFEVS